MAARSGQGRLWARGIVLPLVIGVGMTKKHGGNAQRERPLHPQGGPIAKKPAWRPYVLRVRACILQFCLIESNRPKCLLGAVRRRGAAACDGFPEVGQGEP